MLRIKVSKIGTNVMNFFKKTINQIDQEVKFVKRKSKLNAELFAEALIIGCLSENKITLENLCNFVKARGVKLTKQGLDQRFNHEASLLMKNLLEQSLIELKTEKNAVLDLLKPFDSVKLQDSSGISLPANMKDLFKGCGGTGSEAGLKSPGTF